MTRLERAARKRWASTSWNPDLHCRAPGEGPAPIQTTRRQPGTPRRHDSNGPTASTQSSVELALLNKGYRLINGQWYPPRNGWRKSALGNQIWCRIRQNTKPLLNNLESEYPEQVRAYPGFRNVRCQALRFRLANGIWYKPDITCVNMWSQVIAFEVKGPHAFRGGFENLKMAADQYREIEWVLVWKEDGQWTSQQVLPVIESDKNPGTADTPRSEPNWPGNNYPAHDHPMRTETSSR